MNSYKKIIAPATRYIDASAFEKIDTTEIRWLAGTGFMINTRGIVIMLDPLLIKTNENPPTCEVGLEMVLDFPIKAQDVPKLDILLYTHSDDDHLGGETALILEKLNPRIIGPSPVFEKLVRTGVKPNLIEICRYGDKIIIDSLEIDVLKADHPWQLQNPARYGKRPFRLGDACGFRVKTPDGTILFTGDTRLLEEHLNMECPDVLMLDVSRCEYHLNVKGAIALANLMSDALLIPYHYGTYYAPTIPAHCGDPEDVFANVTEREKRERRLAPGQKLTLQNGKEIVD